MSEYTGPHPGRPFDEPLVPMGENDPGHSLPQWFVAAPHGRRVRGAQQETLWRPVGVQHARMVGTQTTACGAGALTWELFWDMPFPAAQSDSTCAACLRIAQRSFGQ